jgi:hypothetical protein
MKFSSYWLAAAAALVPLAMAQGLEGDYVLTRLVDSSHHTVPLTKGPFKMSLQYLRSEPAAAAANSTSNNATVVVYSFNIVIGNSIGGTLVVDERKETAAATRVWSTRMMPEPDLYRIEVALLAVLDTLERYRSKTIRTNNSSDARILVFRGSQGSFRLRRWL